MKIRTLPIALLVAAIAAPAAYGNFGGGKKDDAQKPTSPGISSMSLTPRQEAERLYVDGHDEVEKAKKDLEAGKAKNAEKKFKKALDRGQRAVDIDPKYAEAWNLIGFSARHIKDYDRALAAYDKALTLKPDFAQAREYLGEAYLELGKPDKAREQLAWLQRIEGASEEAKDLAHELDEYLKAHPTAAASGAPADSGKTAPADTSSGSGGK